MLDNLVKRGGSVPATERESEPGARRGECLEPERRQHLCGAGIPRIRDDERSISVQRPEGG